MNLPSSCPKRARSCFKWIIESEIKRSTLMMFSHLITFISSFSGPLMTIWCDTVKKGKFKRRKNKVIINIQSKLFNLSFFSCTRYPSSLPSSSTLYFDVKQARDTFFTFHIHFSLFGITICNAICSLHIFFST